MKKFEIVEMATLGTVIAGIGAGYGAAIRGNDVVKSSAIVGLGTGVFATGLAFFVSPPKHQPSDLRVISDVALAELLGTAVGYFGAKLFIDTATSSGVFLDSLCGFPVTVGTLYCIGALIQYQQQRCSESIAKSHRR